LIKATIYKSTGSWYNAQDDEGTAWKARIKGVFKIDDITSTNPIAVGDKVDLAPEDEQPGVAMITGIMDRHNYIARQSPHTKHRHHIVAANLDQSLLIATLKEPRTSQGFIDRFLVACEAYHVPAILLFNKKDTWRKKEEAHFDYWKEMYESIGYKVLATSIHAQDGLDELHHLLEHKTTLLSGHSGVGKSSLLNWLFPGMNITTQVVSGWSGKGQHTTTFAEMYDLPFGGRVIDTPGVREFGIVDVGREELSHYFAEMRPYIGQCQFNNCLHYNEPGCAIKDALEAGNIFEDRYVSYLTILDSIPKEEW
jgi:ribosome biogenesis GTPase